jgi:mono/diheme cytochrome c family protein
MKQQPVPTLPVLPVLSLCHLVTLSPCHLVIFLRAALLLALLLSAGCNWPGKPDPANRPVPKNRVVKFTALYGENCAGCHGADGKMGPSVPLNDPVFRSGIDEGELQMVLTFGRKGTPMPGFSHESGGLLTRAQIQILVHEIKGIPYRVIEPENPEEAQEVVRDPEGTKPEWGIPKAPEDVPPYSLAGKDLTRTTKEIDEIRKGLFAHACSGCHGENGHGTRTGDKGVGAINDPEFLALVSNQMLRRIIITGREDLGMPRWKDRAGRGKKFEPLTSEQINDLVALLAYWRQGPARPGGR